VARTAQMRLACSVSLLAAGLGVTAGLATSGVSANTATTSGRIAGADRYATAAAVAQATFPGGTANVVLASGTNFPDALSAAGLAGALRAPVLLTDPASLSPATVTELGALHAQHISIVGGASAVSPTVIASLTGAGFAVAKQYAGANRYDTSAQVAAAITANGGIGTINGTKAAIITTGLNFPDALAAGSPAWAFHLPVLLTDPNTLSPETAQALTAQGIGAAVILGGPSAVSPAVESGINALGVKTLVRFAGANRYDTATQLANFDLAPTASPGAQRRWPPPGTRPRPCRARTPRR